MVIFQVAEKVKYSHHDVMYASVCHGAQWRPGNGNVNRGQVTLAFICDNIFEKEMN